MGNIRGWFLKQRRKQCRVDLIGLDGQKVIYAPHLQFLAINNATKYKALIMSLELAREVGA